MDPERAKELEVEIELLQRVGRGDRGSFETLYDRLAGVLFSSAYRLLNNQAAAEDVLQDVFIQIWEKGASLQSDFWQTADLGVDSHAQQGHRSLAFDAASKPGAG